MAIFGIPSGSVIARLGARRTMLLSDLLRAPLMVLVPVLHWTDGLTFPLLLVARLRARPLLRALLRGPADDHPRGLRLGRACRRPRSRPPSAGRAQVTLIVGPALGGILVAAIGAPEVLLVDAATYVVAFVLVLVFVRAGKPVAQDESSRGVLAGVRFLARDRVLGPMTLTLILLDAAAGALFTSLPALAYLRFGQDPKIVGWLFAAFGIGALGGQRAGDEGASTGSRRCGSPPARWCWSCCRSGRSWRRCPGRRSAPSCSPAACSCRSSTRRSSGMLSTRPPEALRAKVMTAVMTASALGGPAGRIVVGPMFVNWGIAATYAVLAGAISLGALLFVLATLQGRHAAPGQLRCTISQSDATTSILSA